MRMDGVNWLWQQRHSCCCQSVSDLFRLAEACAVKEGTRTCFVVDRRSAATAKEVWEGCLDCKQVLPPGYAVTAGRTCLQ